MPLNEQITLLDDEIIDVVEQEELIEMTRDAINSLGEREQLIIQLYYFEELNLKEISDVLNITQSRISQIHKSVIKKIREKVRGYG